MCIEEALQISQDLLLECFLQNQIIERCIFNGMEELLIFAPTTIIKHKDLSSDLGIPGAYSLYKLVSRLFCICKKPGAIIGTAIYYPVQNEDSKCFILPGGFYPGITNTFAQLSL